MHLTVIGCGYLGAVHAAAMAECGHDVLGVDIDPDKIAALNAGQAPFHEPFLDALLEQHTASGRLRFTTSYQEAAEFGEIHFLCVGTPQRADSDAADTTYLDAAVSALTAHLGAGPALIVGKSTVPVGTARTIAQRLPAGAELAWNPEFLREGFAVEDTLTPDRLVLGVESQNAEMMLRAVYTAAIDAGTPVVTADFATAELIKTAANAFLATKISFINAMAEVCEAAGGDVTVLARGIGHDERIGNRFLRPGVGFGGGCLPKDLRAFAARAEELGTGQSLEFLAHIDAINLRRRQRVVDLARQACDGSLAGKRVAVLGAAFKPDSDDIRDSPALDVAARIHAEDAEVTVHDPRAMDNARKAHPQLSYAATPRAAAEDAHLLLHLTEWPEFARIDPATLPVAARTVIDGRGGLDPARWRAAGWTYQTLGRS
ncbi:UDP-glucose 6-dehydrogenase [Streptomyces umbrinus]|uniref:UDP-glucose dehydrogenase family protein n=1 Tax=Streptomyces umbrinus TaxID=67370 RepID=UPI001675B25D|nr:UDP-glucose/GDP-mannose dehydrogenase family protein [Streptomyces umbrinus]GHB28984.1 UDP-glucose 6-dehydrogenase [Streptomyces umbrinus]